MSGTKCQAFESCLSLSWESSNLITECPALRYWHLKKEACKIRDAFFERERGQRGVISRQFSHLCIILSENCLTYQLCYTLLLNRDPQPVSILFAGISFVKWSGASFSTQTYQLFWAQLTTRLLMRTLTGVAFWDPNVTDPALLSRTGLVGSWYRLIYLVPSWLGPWLHPVLVGCSLFASFPSEHQSAPTNHTPRALHSGLSVFKSQFAWSLKRARRAIKATAVQFPTENFLPISEWVCVCVFTCLKKKKNILVLCTKHFWGRYGAL